jgi:hypothetical protein
MAKTQTINVLSTIAVIGTILVSIITVVSAFFPQLITKSATQSIDIAQYTTDSGEIRPAVVSAQTNVFLIASAVLIMLVGLSFTGFYYLRTMVDAKSAATGTRNSKWHIYLLSILIFIFCLSLGLSLPRAIYYPTNLRELTIEFGLAAWAVKSNVGGIVLGVIFFAISIILAISAYWLLVKMPWFFKRKRVQRRIAKSEINI